MKNYNNIMLCQPDENKGCSACCGLLNFKNISKNYLTDYLNRYELRNIISVEELQNSKDVINNNLVRDFTSYICPYQGFLKSGKPGCKIHPLSTYDGSDQRNLSLFGKKICDNFLCPAHEILTLSEKKILIENCDDWYIYTFAIIDPETTSWLIRLLIDDYLLQPNTEKFKKIFSKILYLITDYLLKMKISVFYYSISEYNLHKNNFSAGSMSENTEQYRKIILESLDRYV